MSCASFHGPGERPRSTLILFTIDSVRAEHLGAYGYRRPTSPVFDELSARGCAEHAYAQAPHTSFSITSLLTGRYFGPLSRMRPGLHLPTLAHRLRQGGYATAAIYPPAVSVLPILRSLRRFATNTLAFSTFAATTSVPTTASAKPSVS